MAVIIVHEGEWVTNSYEKNNPFKFTDEYTSGIGKRDEEWFSKLSPWSPEQDEWCWCWNGDTETPLLRKIVSVKMNTNFPYTTRSKIGIEQTFKHCEPFIGSLPTCLVG